MAEEAAHKIIKNFTKKNRVGAKTELSKFIVIHSTGNTASARNENLNTVNNDHKGVGAHYSVDGVSKVAYAGTKEKDEKWKQFKKKLVG